MRTIEIRIRLFCHNFLIIRNVTSSQITLQFHATQQFDLYSVINELTHLIYLRCTVRMSCYPSWKFSLCPISQDFRQILSIILNYKYVFATLLYILRSGLSSEFCMCSAISPVIKAVHQLFPIREETRYEAIFAMGKKREERRRKKEDKKDGGKKERIMNKGKKGKKKRGKKNTEFVTSRNWVVRFAILYYIYFSPLRVHLLSRLAYETRRGNRGRCLK